MAKIFSEEQKQLIISEVGLGQSLGEAYIEWYEDNIDRILEEYFGNDDYTNEDIYKNAEEILEVVSDEFIKILDLEDIEE